MLLVLVYEQLELVGAVVLVAVVEEVVVLVMSPYLDNLFRVLHL
jgi:hypothetical protein